MRPHGLPQASIRAAYVDGIDTTILLHVSIPIDRVPHKQPKAESLHFRDTKLWTVRKPGTHISHAGTTTMIHSKILNPPFLNAHEIPLHRPSVHTSHYISIHH